MKMKLTMCVDGPMFSKRVETKFEMLLEEYSTEKLILIGVPLKKLPLNCDGLPLIVQKIHDYIVDYGLYDECLFDEAYSNNLRKENIINAYELVTDLGQNCKTIIDVDAVDVATVLIMWLYYLPEPMISPKQFSMICDPSVDKNYKKIISSMDNTSRQTLQQVMNIVDSYGKQHNSYKKKLESLFTLLLTKRVDISGQNNTLQFIDNLKMILIKAEVEYDTYMFDNKCSVIKENFNRDENVFDTNSLCNRKKLFRSLSDNVLHLKAGVTDVNATVKCNALKKSNSCNLESHISKEDDFYNKSFNNGSSSDKNNFKATTGDKLSNNLFNNSSICVIDESMHSSQIDDLRSVERTMPTHFRSIIKRNKKKSIRSHVERVLKSGILSNEDSLLLQNTLELMKILSKLKSVQNQINIQRRHWEDAFGCESENANKHFLNNRLEQLVNQKNNYLSKTGFSYGRSYNRTVLNLKNAQKEALKLHEEEKNNTESQNENLDKLVSDIYNIQVVLDYLENNCGGKELPWRSSKGCPGYRRKTNKQLNCVTVVSDLQTISEHEVMETIAQPLFIQAEHSGSPLY